VTGLALSASELGAEVAERFTILHAVVLVLLTYIWWSRYPLAPDEYAGGEVFLPEEPLEVASSSSLGAAPGAAGSGGGAGTWLEQLPRALDAEGRPGFTHFPPYGHMQGVMLPERRLVVGNQPNPYKFENENCWGLMLPMLRPTADRQFDRPGGWHFGDHFEGKKRLWEFRLEFHLKRPLPGDVHFGIQLEQYVPVGAAAKRLMAVTVGMLRSSLGSNIYHSPGDDPAMVSGEREPPTFTMPLWAFDQFIETPEGEAPPTLDDSRFPELGVRRNKDRRAFLKQMRDVKMRPGPTYTFAFWGIAQYMDTVQWEIRNVMLWHIDFNQFCKAPPVRLVLYALDESQGDEKRHLESRKWYLLNTLFWSSVKPASREKISSFFPRVADGVAEKRSGKGLSPGQGFGFLSCCTARE